MFDNLVEVTEPICQRIDPVKASMALFDTSGILTNGLGIVRDITFYNKGFLAVNQEGIPCCPHDPSLVMKREGSKSHLRCGLPTMKFVCPKMKWNTIKTQVNPNGLAIVKIPVPILLVAG